MKVAALGRSEILYRSISKIQEGGHDIVLIITCEEASDYNVVSSDFERLAKEMKIDFMQTERLNAPEAIQLIEKNKPDVAISVNWRTLISQETIDRFPHGIINAHAGDLPRYRGNAVPNWAIIQGEDKIVLTLHSMTSELDAGPIVLQRKIPVTEKTYIGEVYACLNNAFPEMFLEAVNGFADGSITPREQPKDPALSLRCLPRTPRDGEIDWSQPAEQLDRLVRAVSEPFAGAYTFIGTEKLIIWRAHRKSPLYPFVGTPGQVAERRPETGEVAVVTGEGLLVLEEVENRIGRRKKATDIIRTIRTRLGMDVTEEIKRLREELEEVKSKIRPE